MRWIRFFCMIVSARFRSRLRINDQSEIVFKVWITDIDVSIMNHAAMMTVMETGRIDFMIRTGFFKLAQKSKWYFPSSSIHVQFFRPLKLFQRATLITRVFHINERWIYLEQRIIRNKKIIATCVVRSTIKKGRQQVNILEVLSTLNIGEAPLESVEFISSFEAADRLMNENFAH